MNHTFKTVLLVALSGCSVSPPTAPLVVNPSLVVDIFAARGFLGGTDYEQYKLVSGVMWRECGAIAKTKGEDVKIIRIEKNLTPTQRRVEDLSVEEQVTIAEAVDKLFAISQTSKDKLAAPGSIFSLMEPGILEVNIELNGKKKRFLTSVDAVAEPVTPIAKSLREVFATTRGVGPVICNAKTFYGVRRKAPSLERMS